MYINCHICHVCDKILLLVTNVFGIQGIGDICILLNIRFLGRFLQQTFIKQLKLNQRYWLGYFWRIFFFFTVFIFFSSQRLVFWQFYCSLTVDSNSPATFSGFQSCEKACKQAIVWFMLNQKKTCGISTHEDWVWTPLIYRYPNKGSSIQVQATCSTPCIIIFYLCHFG